MKGLTDVMYTLAELKAMPNISSAQTDDLKVDTGTIRVWLARTGVADGEKYNDRISVEVLKDGRWIHKSNHRGSVTIED